jgi:hypothetical protein
MLAMTNIQTGQIFGLEICVITPQCEWKHTWSTIVRPSVCPQVLYPELDVLLQLEDWSRWDATLKRITYDEAEMATFLEHYAASKARIEERRACQQEQQAEQDHLLLSN